MSDILYDCAKAIEKIMEYEYSFYIARSKTNYGIDLRCLKGEAIHVMGLEHLTDLPEFKKKSLAEKENTFQRLISPSSSNTQTPDITLADIMKSHHFFSPFPETYNSATQSEYGDSISVCHARNIYIHGK